MTALALAAIAGWHLASPIHTAEPIVGRAGQTAIPAALVEDLLHAPIYYGMGGIGDEIGIRGSTDALDFARRAAQLIEYARTRGLQPRNSMPNSAEIERLLSSGLSRYTLGGVAGRLESAKLRPSSMEFLRLNLRSAEALIEDVARRNPHTPQDVDAFFTMTDCDFYTMASRSEAEAALKEIQHGKNIRQAIWDHQDSYVDERGAGFETSTVSYWSDADTRNALAGLKIGQVSQPIGELGIKLAIPRAHLSRSPYSSAEPLTDDEKERLYRVVTASESLVGPIESMTFQWSSVTANLIEGETHLPMQGSLDGPLDDNAERRRSALSGAMDQLEAGDLPELAERLAVLCSTGTKEELATLEALARRSDSGDIEARLGKCYAQAGDIRRSASCYARACQLPAIRYGIAFQSQLKERDLSNMLNSSDAGKIDPKDRSILEQRVAVAEAQRKKWAETRTNSQPLSPEQEVQRRKSQEFLAYANQLIKAERAREVAYYQDKIAYLSERLTQTLGSADQTSTKALSEEIRMKRDRAASRFETLKQQIRNRSGQ